VKGAGATVEQLHCDVQQHDGCRVGLLQTSFSSCRWQSPGGVCGSAHKQGMQAPLRSSGSASTLASVTHAHTATRQNLGGASEGGAQMTAYLSGLCADTPRRCPAYAIYQPHMYTQEVCRPSTAVPCQCQKLLHALNDTLRPGRGCGSKPGCCCTC
jgi:hypothetical protein